MVSVLHTRSSNVSNGYGLSAARMGNLAAFRTPLFHSNNNDYTNDSDADSELSHSLSATTALTTHTYAQTNDMTNIVAVNWNWEVMNVSAFETLIHQRGLDMRECTHGHRVGMRNWDVFVGFWANSHMSQQCNMYEHEKVINIFSHQTFAPLPASAGGQVMIVHQHSLDMCECTHGHRVGVRNIELPDARIHPAPLAENSHMPQRCNLYEHEKVIDIFSHQAFTPLPASAGGQVMNFHTQFGHL